MYAYHSDSGALLRRVSLLGSGETVNDLPSYGCQRVAPTIGITSTPMIDRGAIDVPPYSGWIIAYSASTLARTMVFNAAPNGGGVGPSCRVPA